MEQRVYESSYVDLLTELRNDVEKDVIMSDLTKEVALNLIRRLESMLWPYSA